MTVVPSPVVYESWGQRVVFGSGTVQADVAAAVTGLGASRVLVIAAEGERALAEDICKDLPVVAVFGGVRPHVPAEVARAVRDVAHEHAADLLLSVGGGSTTGTAKAAALTTGLPILAVPTTYAGSEATPVWGLTEDGHKRTGVDAKVFPKVVVYDATLMLSLPTRLSVTSGLNALAHCVDAWWAPRHNPISSALAVEGVRSLASALPASSPTARTSSPAARSSSAPTSARWLSRAPVPGCITRCVTSSAVRTTSNTPPCTRWSCRTWSASTWHRRPKRPATSERRSTNAPTPSARCSPSTRSSNPRPR